MCVQQTMNRYQRGERISKGANGEINLDIILRANNHQVEAQRQAGPQQGKSLSSPQWLCPTWGKARMKYTATQQ